MTMSQFQPSIIVIKADCSGMEKKSTKYHISSPVFPRYATENIEGAPLDVGNCSGMWLREKSNNGAANEEEKSLENK